MKTPRLVGAFLFVAFVWLACVASAGLFAGKPRSYRLCANIDVARHL